MLITWRGWPARERFLKLLQDILQATPQRVAYYPGARERYARFAGGEPPSGPREKLPWTLLRDVQPTDAPHLFQEESFVCVCAEMALDATSSESFLGKAVEFVNDQMFGTLSVALTIPAGFERGANNSPFQDTLHRLRYGAIGINQWPALVYAMMGPPWGGHPSSTLDDAQSGLGWVHNTYMLSGCEKTILRGPLTMIPKPIWFANHRHADSVARSLFRLYSHPRPTRLLPLLLHAMRG
jgi:hypothetical protein